MAAAGDGAEPAIQQPVPARALQSFSSRGLVGCWRSGRYVGTWQALVAGLQQGLGDPGQAGTKMLWAPCRRRVSHRWSQHLRFPPCVYALTTARSAGTLQISDDCLDEALISRLSLSHHHHRRRHYLQARILDSNPDLSSQQPTMPSQEAGSSSGSPSGSADRQAQDAQAAGATSPPRTEQELAQVRTPKSMSSPQQKQHTRPSHSAIFHNHVFASSPSRTPLTIQTPRSWGPPRFSQDPEVYCITHPCPVGSSTGAVAAPVLLSTAPRMRPELPVTSSGRPAFHIAPCPRTCQVLCHVQSSAPC